MPPRNSTTAAAMRGDHAACDVTSVQLAPSFDAQTALLAEWPGSRPLYQPPIIHIRPLKAMVMGRSPWSQGAVLVTRFHALPSREFQTSRGGASNELNHPPRSHRRSWKTISPCESLGCHCAAGVSSTQSGPVRTADCNSAIGRMQAAADFQLIVTLRESIKKRNRTANGCI